MSVETNRIWKENNLKKVNQYRRNERRKLAEEAKKRKEARELAKQEALIAYK